MARKKGKAAPVKKSRKKPVATTREPVATAKTPKHFLWISICLAAFAFALYANTIGHEYVLDDPLAIGKNELVKQGISGIPELFTNHYRAGTEGAGASALLYRPMSLVTFAIEWSLAPESPFLGHFMNVLWYALTVGLLFAALRHLLHTHHWLWAAGAALLFAAHPLHTEVVANIKSRDEILNLFFSVAALYAWARWLEGPKLNWMLLALVSYFMALLSKESAVTLLPVFPLASWFFFKKSAKQSGGHALLFAGPVLVFLLIRMAVLSQTTDNFEVSEMDNPIIAAQGIAEYTATSFMVLWKYLQLLLFPITLLSDYSFKHLEVVNWTQWQAVVGLLLYGGLIFFAIRGLSRRHPLAFCAAAFLCAVFLYSQLPLTIGTLLGERLMYTPSLWFCLGISYLIWQATGFSMEKDLQGNKTWPAAQLTRTGMLVLGVFALLAATKTVLRNADWKDNLTLFLADSAKAPNSVRLHNGIGSESYTRYLQSEETAAPEEKEAWLRQMVEHANAAVAIRPNPVSYLNLGNAAISKNDYALAIKNYQEALNQAPGYGLARINIGRTYQAWGRVEGLQNKNFSKAAEYLEKALEYGKKRRQCLPGPRYFIRHDGAK